MVQVQYVNKATLHKRQRYIPTKNPLETVQNSPKGVAGSVVNDVLRGGVNDFWRQVLGAGNSTANSEVWGNHAATRGDLKEGEDLIISSLQKREQNKNIEIEAGEVAVEYKRQILHGESRATRKISQEIETKTQEILAEIKRLIQTTREIQVEFREVAAEQRVVKPGKYHKSFFEWMLSVIRQARIKVEDSGAWLAVTKSKQQKRQYWAMFKKHGTTFGLSNERIVATQTG